MSSRVPFWSRRWEGERLPTLRTRGRFGGLAASKIARMLDLPAKGVWEGLVAMERQVGRSLTEPEVFRFMYQAMEAKLRANESRANELARRQEDSERESFALGTSFFDDA